jgi:20S proteasome subunit beta 3
VSPVIAGLNEKNEPFLSAFDFIGAACHAKDFVVAGTSSEQLYGVCEAFWREDMVRII